MIPDHKKIKKINNIGYLNLNINTIESNNYLTNFFSNSDKKNNNPNYDDYLFTTIQDSLNNGNPKYSFNYFQSPDFPPSTKIKLKKNVSLYPIYPNNLSYNFNQALNQNNINGESLTNRNYNYISLKEQLPNNHCISYSNIINIPFTQRQKQPNAIGIKTDDYNISNTKILIPIKGTYKKSISVANIKKINTNNQSYTVGNEITSGNSNNANNINNNISNIKSINNINKINNISHIDNSNHITQININAPIFPKSKSQSNIFSVLKLSKNQSNEKPPQKNNDDFSKNIVISPLKIDQRPKTGNVEKISKTNSKTSTKKSDEIEPEETFNPEEFKIIKQIGSGSYGKIFCVEWERDKKKYALKKEMIKYAESVEKKLEKTEMLLNFIKKTKCTGVIRVYGDVYQRVGKQFIYYQLMEIAERDWEQELFIRQKYSKYYSEAELFTILSQLVKTFALLQRNHITHRDVKPQNVLISNGQYKICDFGEARVLIRNGVVCSRVRGTELYMAPILFHGLHVKMVLVSHNTYKSDVFSLGMCIFFAATLTFDSLCDMRELNDMDKIKEVLLRYLCGRYSFKLINILMEMLQVDENNRPDFIILEKKHFKKKE